jgi:hypothetical protein
VIETGARANHHRGWASIQSRYRTCPGRTGTSSVVGGIPRARAPESATYPAQPKRRRFTAGYELCIVREADAALPARELLWRALRREVVPLAPPRTDPLEGAPAPARQRAGRDAPKIHCAKAISLGAWTSPRHSWSQAGSFRRHPDLSSLSHVGRPLWLTPSAAFADIQTLPRCPTWDDRCG